MNYYIHGILIIRNGYNVFDVSVYPYHPRTTQELHSCTRSIFSTLIGIARDEGKIKSLEQPVSGFFPVKEFKNQAIARKNILLKHLLTMTSGLDTKASSNRCLVSATYGA